MKSKQECPKCGREVPADAPEGICPACLAAAFMKTEAPFPGRVESMPVEEIAGLFPELEILGMLGSGGMGAVYKARQPKLDRLVALKILDRHDGDPRFVERFTREAKTLARLSHPSIVTVYEFGEREGLPFLIMELVDGVTLRSLLRAGKMPPEQALAIVPPICEALQYAHDKGVIHRDIKPENILVDKEGRVKVADFGIARLMEVKEAEEHLTGDAERVGTAHYMAPEQVEHPGEVDHRADIYALGVVFYEMLTGELPLGKFPQPSKRVRIDVRLDEVVLKALEKEPARRYQQASEVETAVTMVSASSAAGSDEAHAEWKNPDNWTGPKWLSVYFSKRDRRVWVPKQISALGWTINLGRPGGVVWLFTIIIGLPLIILLIAFFVTNSGDRANEIGLNASSLEDAPKGELVAEAPFIARLPQGSIELVAVSYHPSDDQPWWRPDGSDYDGPPVFTWGGSSRAYGDERPREFVFRRSDVPDGSDVRFVFDPPSSQAGNMVGFEPGVPDYELMALSATLPAVTDTFTIKVGAGSGPWRTISETRAGSGASGITEGDWSVAFASQTEIDGSARVTVAHNIEGHSLRMVAVDLHGEPHTASLSGIGTSGFSAQNATFHGLPLDNIVSFELQVRPYAWAEFRNVSLEPGQPTRVEVGHAPATAELALVTGSVQFSEQVSRSVVGGETFSQSEPEFVVHLPRRMGTEVLDAFRAFVHEHRWRMRSESGNDEYVLLRATDLAGKHVTARLEASGQNDGQSSLTIATEAGAELSARRIGYAIGTRVGLRIPEADSTTTGLQAEASPRVFGEVMERVVYDDGVGRDFFIDLDSGRLSSPPPGLNPENQDAVLLWAEMEGVDAMGETGASVRGLVGFGLKVRPIPSERWATISAAEVVADAALRETVAGTYTFMSAKGETPETFLFETREGSRGVLQITGFTDDPRGVRIRYKLVVNEEPIRATTPDLERAIRATEDYSTD